MRIHVYECHNTKPDSRRRSVSDLYLDSRADKTNAWWIFPRITTLFSRALIIRVSDSRTAGRLFCNLRTAISLCLLSFQARSLHDLKSVKFVPESRSRRRIERARIGAKFVVNQLARWWPGSEPVRLEISPEEWKVAGRSGNSIYGIRTIRIRHERNTSTSTSFPLNERQFSGNANSVYGAVSSGAPFLPNYTWYREKLADCNSAIFGSFGFVECIPRISRRGLIVGNLQFSGPPGRMVIRNSYMYGESVFHIWTPTCEKRLINIEYKFTDMSPVGRGVPMGCSNLLQSKTAFSVYIPPNLKKCSLASLNFDRTYDSRDSISEENWLRVLLAPDLTE